MYNRVMNNNLKLYTDTFTDFSKKRISDFILYNSGIEYCEPGYSYGPKRRDYHFIHFVKEGKGLLEIENQTIEVHQNQLFIVPANTVSTYTADETNPWKYSWIGFTGIESLNFVQMMLQSNPKQFVKNCEDIIFFENKIEQIIELNQNTLSSYFKINGLMYEIIGYLLSECELDTVINDKTTISYQAMNYMDLHYHDDIQIADVAYFLGVHPNYLSTVFKEQIGISPKNYLSNLKVSKAKKLLTESNDPIYWIAGSVGFNDALSFSKFFKKETGVSPSNYRKEQTINDKLNSL